MLQVVCRNTNRTSYVLGEITRQEAELAAGEDPAFNGIGIYLMVSDPERLDEPARVLAKFISEDAALHLANFFRANGFLER